MTLTSSYEQILFSGKIKHLHALVDFEDGLVVFLAPLDNTRIGIALCICRMLRVELLLLHGWLARIAHHKAIGLMRRLDRM